MVAELLTEMWELAVTHSDFLFVTAVALAIALTVLGMAREFSLANLTMAGILLAGAAVFYHLAMGGWEELLSGMARAILFGVVITIILKKVEIWQNGG